MLFFEEESGEFKNKTIADEDIFIITIYNEKEDWKDLDGQVPYRYGSPEELMKGLKKDTQELIDYIQEDQVLVIRKINCKVLREV